MLGLRKGAGIRIFRQNSFVSVPNHFVVEPFCVSESFTYWKILCQRGEYHDFLLKICCLRVPKKLRKGNLLCFAKFLVSENFMDKRGEGGREYHDFMSKILSHSTEKFRRETLVSENFWYRKMLGFRKGAGIRIFRQNNFVSVPNHFVEEPFCVSESFTY